MLYGLWFCDMLPVMLHTGFTTVFVAWLLFRVASCTDQHTCDIDYICFNQFNSATVSFKMYAFETRI